MRDCLDRFGTGLSGWTRVTPAAATSYTVVLNVPGVDRVFLHCPGANDVFGADSVPDATLAGADWLHFGYPPLMRRMYENDGAELVKLFARAKEAGLRISLDLARPDPDSPAGRVDWPRLLRNVLPWVDIIFPSFDEITYMLDGAVETEPTPERLRAVACRLHAKGAGVVVMKLGSMGLYLHTGTAGEWLGGHAGEWAERELYHPCFRVEVAGATGAGDCTIGGFLFALQRKNAPEACLRAATAVGACNVERPDTTSGIRPWAEVSARLAAGWACREPGAAFAGWKNITDDVWEAPR